MRNDEPASGKFQFENSTPVSPTTEAEQLGVAISPAEKRILDDLGGNEAEGDAISAIAERKISMGKPGRNPDGKAVQDQMPQLSKRITAVCSDKSPTRHFRQLLHEFEPTRQRSLAVTQDGRTS